MVVVVLGAPLEVRAAWNSQLIEQHHFARKDATTIAATTTTFTSTYHHANDME